MGVCTVDGGAFEMNLISFSVPFLKMTLIIVSLQEYPFLVKGWLVVVLQNHRMLWVGRDC